MQDALGNVTYFDNQGTSCHRPCQERKKQPMRKGPRSFPGDCFVPFGVAIICPLRLSEGEITDRTAKDNITTIRW